MTWQTRIPNFGTFADALRASTTGGHAFQRQAPCSKFVFPAKENSRLARGLEPSAVPFHVPLILSFRNYFIYFLIFEILFKELKKGCVLCGGSITNILLNYPN